MLYAIITRNQLCDITVIMYAIIPTVVALNMLIICFTYRVQNETTHQMVWFLFFAFEAALLTANQIAWRWSFSTALHTALLPFQHEDPTALFCLTEMGWFVDTHSSVRNTPSLFPSLFFF
jgi:hypothetical protein